MHLDQVKELLAFGEVELADYKGKRGEVREAGVGGAVVEDTWATPDKCALSYQSHPNLFGHLLRVAPKRAEKAGFQLVFSLLRVWVQLGANGLANDRTNLDGIGRN